ncbi:MAG: hypothetical protein IPO43_04620 [Rhodoferax sp.]|nr:hypothetical protein [Rhodoferax sp.]
MCYVGTGLGTVVASTLGNRISRHLGPGPRLALGFAVCVAGWLQPALAPSNAWGVLSFVVMLLCFSAGAVLIFITFLVLRQAVTPEHQVGRMTSTMRWLILIPPGPVLCWAATGVSTWIVMPGCRRRGGIGLAPRVAGGIR